MVPTVLESVPVGDATNFNRAARTSASPAGVPCFGSLLRKLAMTTAVWILYVPHLTVLKVLGPQLGPGWARFVGRLHWLLTFLGAERSTRTIIRKLHPYLQSDASVATILRKHLELKHECFARIRAFGQQRPWDAPGDIVWDVDQSCRQRFQKVRSSGNGLIIVGYHFGFFRLSASALPRVFPGCAAVQVSHRNAHYEGQTVPGVARLALEKALVADQHSRTPIHYVDGESSMVRLFRSLRAGEVVALTADGLFARDFLDVPFLGGKLRLPCGWARLAAATHSDVLILADTEVDYGRRKGLLFDEVHVRDDSPDEIYRVVSQAASILEDLVRREPWSWHPWQRIRHETTDDGARLLTITTLGRSRLSASAGADLDRSVSSVLASAPTRTSASPTETHAAKCNGGMAMDVHEQLASSNGSVGGRPTRTPRVAIIANSFTPYRIYVHKRIINEVPEVELWTLMTHGNSYNRWHGLEPPEEIRPRMFGNGEPTIEQTKLRFALREWRKFGRIIRWLDEHQVEAVICQGFGDVGRLRLIRWCNRRSIPCFITADCNINGDVRRGAKRLLKHIVVGQAVRWASGVMPCGEFGRLLFERYGASRSKTFMFPLISDLELFSNAPEETMKQVREQYDLDPRRRRILFCGRMMRVKRPDLTISAFTALAGERPDWDLVMVGDGVLRKPMAAAVPPHLQNRVKWLGLIQDTAELASIFSQCDVLVLPSDKEPWGMVAIEAAAAGLALVMTSVVGASPELVSNGENGWVFPPGDLAAFTTALRDVTQPDRIDEMKASTRQVLSRWMSDSDPVDGFRAAMASCRLIPRHSRPDMSVARHDPLSSVEKAVTENPMLV